MLHDAMSDLMTRPAGGCAWMRLCGTISDALLNCTLPNRPTCDLIMTTLFFLSLSVSLLCLFFFYSFFRCVSFGDIVNMSPHCFPLHMVGSFTTAAARRPLAAAPPHATNQSRMRAKGASTLAKPAGAGTKRARSPCADEIAYRDSLLPRHEALAAQLAIQAEALADLEQSVLTFYVANMIEVESTTTTSGSDASLPGSTPPSASRIRYYHTSTIAKARAARAQLCRERKEEREQLEKKIADMEDEVERAVVRGVLADQRAVTEAEEQALAHREEALSQSQATTSSLQRDIAAEKAKLPAIAADMEACEARIQRLEEKKRKQMENVEQTRQDVAQQRQETQTALAELQRRQKNVTDLEKEIERRLCLLKRAKRRD